MSTKAGQLHITTARSRLPEAVALDCRDVREFLGQTPENSFDLILLHHVLEHIPRQHTISLLREFHRCLAPGGLLSLRTPNAACMLSGVMCFGDFTHVVHFNEISLVQVLEQAGFAADAVEIVLHPPQLFWSWRNPRRAALRVANRIRWHINDWAHRLLATLADVQPRLRCTEREIEVLVRR